LTKDRPLLEAFPVERDRGEPLAEPSAHIADLLAEALEELGFRDPGLRDRLTSLVELVLAWSARINLTGHRDRESIARGLVLDALGLTSLIPDEPSLVDLGSGAGFPGLPIALARPGCRITLLESRAKRHHFQRAAIRELTIENAEARLGRAEILEPTLHRVAVARAVGRLKDVIPWMVRWLEPGGLLLVPIRSGSHPSEPVGAVSLGIRSYRAPLGGPERQVWVGSKDATHRL
jgi:16S rRNA (guanine527-N7)-methyltransferase